MHFSTVAGVSLLVSSAVGASIGVHQNHAKLHAKHRPRLFKRDSHGPNPNVPFSKIVAFGDDFTDNGQGSYAHGITGNEQTGEGALMWGNGTFTDGQVAVSYMAQDLGIPLATDYAFGSSSGAENVGSVCDTALVQPTQISGYAKLRNGNVVPSALEQVANYSTSPGASDNAYTLHFFWTGNNDVIASLGWAGRFTICTDGKCEKSQTDFVNGVVSCMRNSLNKLVDTGAYYVIVPNIYPRHLAPWTELWIAKDQGHVDNFGSVIDDINNQLLGVVNDINAQRGTNITYYDANGWFKRAMADSAISGVAGGDNGYTNTCVDGCVIQNPTGKSNWQMYWDNTIVKKQPDDFFWMTEVVPSTTVMKKLGEDMANFLAAQDFWW